MPNYVKEVLTDVNGYPNIVICKYGLRDIHFSGKNGKACCLSGTPPTDEKIEGKIYGKMKDQATAIFKENKKRNPNAKILKYPERSIHHRHWLGNERERLQKLLKLRVFVINDGSLIILRTEKGVDIEQSYPNIDAAIRAQDHIIKKYLGGDGNCELDVINYVQSAIAQANQFFLLWTSRLKGEHKHISSRLDDALEILERARNELKKSAADQILKITDMKDSAGKQNPGALAARTIAASNRLKKRQDEIGRIIPYIAARHGSLIIEKHLQAIHLASAEIILRAILASSPAFFKNRLAFEKRANQTLYHLQSLWTEPFAAKACEVFRLVKEAKLNQPKMNLTVAHTILANMNEPEPKRNKKR